MPSPISNESSGLAITERNGEFFVTSETVAAGAGVEHRAVLQLIDNNAADFEDFGHLAFEMQDRNGSPGPRRRVALLNEQQSTLLMTYQRNTEQVRQFKKALVKAFYEMARQVQPALSDQEIVNRALQITTAQVQELRAKVEQDAPKVAQVDTLRLSDGLVTISDLAVLLKTHAVANFPGAKIKRDDVFDLAGNVGLIIRGNTVRHNQPTAKAVEARWVKPADHTYDTNNHGTRTTYYARLTHRGAGRLWDAAIHNLNTYGAVLAPKPGVHS